MRTQVAIIGAGIMGAGIAQVAAQAGHPVLLHDAREGAAIEAKAKLAKSLDTLVAKGKLDAIGAENIIGALVTLIGGIWSAVAPPSRPFISNNKRSKLLDTPMSMLGLNVG